MKTELIGFVSGGEIKYPDDRPANKFFIDVKVCGNLGSGTNPVTKKGVLVSLPVIWHNLGGRVKITVELF